MLTSVAMPRLGESVAEGTIGSWLKQEGDYVEKDEALAEIITDKINAELPSPVAGRLTKILVAADQTVAVGVDIAMIEENADTTTTPPPAVAPGSDAAPVKSAAQAATPVVDQQSARSATHSATQSAQPVSETQVARTPSGSESDREGTSGSEEERKRISPLARRLASEHNIDLNAIAGTGIGGRVRKEDILAYIAQQQSGRVATPVSASYRNETASIAPSLERAGTGNAFNGSNAPGGTGASAVGGLTDITSGGASGGSQPGSVVTTTVGEDEELVVPSRMRLGIAEHMVRSKRTSPHATTVVEVDMTNIAKWLEKNKEEFKRREGYGISFVPFVIKATCEGIRKFPLLNSTWTPDNKIIIKKCINIGIAVATDVGLVVPTIHDADQYTLAGLARQVSVLAQKARNNRLALQDIQNSTFVVNNPGVFGTIISVPIINQPHAGILSMDAVVKRPVVIEDDAIAVRSMMYLCLSFDHRILDGAGAAGFLQAVRNKLQSYGREIDVY